MDAYTIKLSSVNLGQTLDALEIRAEAWESTAQVLRGERSDVLIEECDDAEEAERLAAHYRGIAADIRAQVAWGAPSAQF